MEIPELSRMFFEYCWSQTSKFAVKNDFEESCAYGNYERVSELLEENPYKVGKVTNILYYIDNIERWDHGLQEVCLVGYTKIAILIVNYFVDNNWLAYLKWDKAFIIADSQGHREIADLMLKKAKEQNYL